MRIWTIRTRLTFFFVSAIAICSFSTFGYYIIKNYVEEQPVTVIDSIYWSVVTLSTLGAYPPGGELMGQGGKLFTIICVMAGIFLIFIGVPFIATPWLERRLAGAIKPKAIPVPEKDHVILCGFDEVARYTLRELKMHDIPSVVILNEKIEHADLHGIPTLTADPIEDHHLRKANVDTAMAMILTGNDSTNAFICLAAKRLRPDLRIISNLQNTKHEKVLYRAGATKVISSKSIAAALIANRAQGMHDLHVVEESEILKGLDIAQFTITASNPLKGLTLKATKFGQVTGATVLGYWDKGELTFNPPPNFVLREGVIIVILGTKNQLEKAKQLMSGGEGA